MAAPVALGAVVAVGRAGLHAEPQTPPTAPAVTTTQARSPRNASYAINVRLDPASRTLEGRRAAHLAQHHRRRPQPACAFTSTTTPGATPPRRGCASAAGRRRPASTRRPQADWGWIDVTSLRLIAADGTPTDLTSNLRFIAPDDGNPDDATVGEVPLGGAGAARADRERADRLVVARAAHLRAHRRRSATSIFSRSGSRRSACSRDDGWNCHQFHAGDRVLLRLRRLRRAAHRAERLDRRRHRRERDRRDEGDGTTTHPLLRGGRARFRLDDEPATTSSGPRRSSIRGCRRWRCGCCCSPSTRPGGAALRSATRATLKYYGEWFGPYPYGHITIVDPAWQSGAGGMEYPTLFTAGTRWLAPPRRRAAGRRHGPRGRPPVLVRHRRHQRVRARVDGRRVQHVLDRADARAVLQADLLLAALLRRLHPVGVRGLPLSRATDGNRLAGYRTAAHARCAGDADAGATGRAPPGRSPTTRRRCG